jgi:hypothetical protein
MRVVRSPVLGNQRRYSVREYSDQSAVPDYGIDLATDSETITVFFEGPRGDEVSPANLHEHCKAEGLSTYESPPDDLELADLQEY